MEVRSEPVGVGLERAFDGLVYEPAVVVRMRDGARLVADVYRPAEGGPWPVLLMRQPYGRDIASTVVYAHPTWYARLGFLVVVQDVRGRGDSEGEFDPFVNEEADGVDTVRWAAALPASNGRVGMYGFSYQGSTQLLAALGRPEGLRALAPHMTAFDLYSGWFYRGGLLQLSTTLGWGNQMLREDARRRGLPEAAALEESWLAAGRLSQALPVAGVAPLTGPGLPRYVAEWLEHDEKDAYWERRDLLARVADLGVPMFHLGGWYDFYARGTIDGYRAMAAAHPNQALVAGPWVHLPWGPKTPGGDCGSAAVPAVDEQQAAWFHHWLDAEEPEGVPALRGVRYFVLGGNRWETASSWPPPGVREQTWWLASDGRANGRFGNGRLSEDGPGGPDDLFSYDPEVPVTAPGGNLGGGVAWGPHDLSQQQQGLNLLCFTGPPVVEPLVIAGRPRVELFVRSSAPDTAFVVRLSRVLPDGRAIFLTLGAGRLRDGARERGGAVRLVLPLDDVAVELAAGERLRLDVASSAFPLLVRHPNTMESPNRVAGVAGFRRALQVVYHDVARPSRVVVPVH